MNKLIKITVIVVTMMMLHACGKATIEPKNESYEQKIVIEGFLIAGQTVDRLFITKNFTVDSDLNNYNLIPDPEMTEVTITDLSSGNIYNLSFHLEEKEIITEAYWRYEGKDFTIQPGNMYQLNVSTIIDDERITANAQTTVPEKGFSIETINQTELKYRAKNESGELVNFSIKYARSP